MIDFQYLSKHERDFFRTLLQLLEKWLRIDLCRRYFLMSEIPIFNVFAIPLKGKYNPGLHLYDMEPSPGIYSVGFSHIWFSKVGWNHFEA